MLTRHTTQRDDTDYQEEQAMEVEALESIYMDEFKSASLVPAHVLL